MTARSKPFSIPEFVGLLAGRFLQGLGAAAPRTVSIALVRDGGTVITDGS